MKDEELVNQQKIHFISFENIHIINGYQSEESSQKRIILKS